jgi:uncharacterized FlaG/YvyC family protein
MDPINRQLSMPADPLWMLQPVSVSDTARTLVFAGFTPQLFQSEQVTGSYTTGSEDWSGDSLYGGVEKLVEELNKHLISKHVSLNFWIDEQSNSVVVQVIESESGKVIRQIPPDAILSIRNRLQELTGIMLDTVV